MTDVAENNEFDSFWDNVLDGRTGPSLLSNSTNRDEFDSIIYNNLYNQSPDLLLDQNCEVARALALYDFVYRKKLMPTIIPDEVLPEICKT